jgi:glycerate-2-kinase
MSRTYKEILERYCEKSGIKGVVLGDNITGDADYARVLAQLISFELFPEDLEPFHD